MAVLPIGFFMPLPLPIMIPFMMWQSAAIAAGFGTYFQYSKRRISAMSNDEFNKFTPSQGVNEMFDDIMSQIPSSFERARSINKLILQSLADFLEDGIKFLSSKLGGQFDSPFQFSGPPVEQPDKPDSFVPNPFTILNPLPPAGGEIAPPTSFIPPPTPELIGPPAPPLTQKQLLDKYANWETYRQKGGLLTEQQWRVARRGKDGGIPNIPPQPNEPQGPQGPEQGKIFHPSYVRQLQSLQNNKIALVKQLEVIDAESAKVRADFQQSTTQSVKNSFALQLGVLARKRSVIIGSLQTIDITITEFIKKFKPNK